MVYELHFYLYAMWDVCFLPITGLSTTDDLLKLLCCPQGLGRCYLLHMCITAYVKYLAFNFTKVHLLFPACIPNLLRLRWILNLPSSMPAVHPNSVPSVGLASLLPPQWWWQSSAVHLGNSLCVHFLCIFLNLSLRNTGCLCARLSRGHKSFLNVETCSSNVLGPAECQGRMQERYGSAKALVATTRWMSWG